MRAATASLFVSMLVLPASAAVVATAPSAHAQGRSAAYRVGMRLRARQDCTIRGYAVKKGVVLDVVMVHRDDSGKERAVDLGFRGMTIRGVDVRTVATHFRRA